MVFPHRRTARRDNAFDFIGVFDGHRQPVQHAQIFAPRLRLVSLQRQLAGPLNVLGDDSIELRIMLLDTRHEMLKQFARADLAALDHAAKACAGTKMEGLGHGDGFL